MHNPSVKGKPQMKCLFCIGIFFIVFWGTACSEDNFEISQTGGVQLQYQLDLSLTRKDQVDATAKQVKKIISRRLDGYGIKRKKVRIMGKGTVLVQIPEITEKKTIKAITGVISADKKMTFRLSAKDKNKMSQSGGGTPVSAKEAEISRVEKEWEDYRRDLAAWSRKFIAAEKQQQADEPPREPDSVVRVEYEKEKKYDKAGRTVFSTMIDPETKKPVIKRKLILCNEPGNKLEVEKYVKSARSSYDEMNMGYTIQFNLNNRGAVLFENLTGNHIQEFLAIEVDGEIKSTAIIWSVISDRVQISGRISQEEARSLAAVLSGGSLPVKLKLIKENVIKPQPGKK